MTFFLKWFPLLCMLCKAHGYIIIRVIFTFNFVYWDCLYITVLKSILCPGETTSFFKTHTRLNYDSEAGDLSVLSFVMTFTAMASVISSGFCYFSPRISTWNVGSIFQCKDLTEKSRVSTFPISVVIFDLSISGSVNFNILRKQISRNLRIHLQPVNYIFLNTFWPV